MKYFLLLLIVGCTSTPEISNIPGEYIIETDIRMCIENPDSPWCVIECEKHDKAWCK